MARSGFDWLLLDLEHGAGTESELLASLHAMGATPAAALVRPQSGERLRIGRALDLGAHGIMVPRVDTARAGPRGDLVHALPARRHARARALDARGGSRRARPYADPGDQPPDPGHHPDRVAERGRARRRDRRHRWRRRPVRRPDRPVAQPRGPRQLRRSGLSRCHRATSPTTAEAAGKVAGILLRDASSLARHRDLGFRFIGLGSDGAFISDGARAVLAATARLTAAGQPSPRPPPRAASPVPAPRAVAARSGR